MGAATSELQAERTEELISAVGRLMGAAGQGQWPARRWADRSAVVLLW